MNVILLNNYHYYNGDSSNYSNIDIDDNNRNNIFISSIETTVLNVPYSLQFLALTCKVTSMILIMMIKIIIFFISYNFACLSPSLWHRLFLVFQWKHPAYTHIHSLIQEGRILSLPLMLDCKFTTPWLTSCTYFFFTR